MENGDVDTVSKNVDKTDAEASKAERINAEKAHILNAVSAGKLGTIPEKVAWLLNFFPKTRDSDITLQMEYWDEFDGQKGRFSH